MAFVSRLRNFSRVRDNFDKKLLSASYYPNGCFSVFYSSFKFSDLTVNLAQHSEMKKKPDPNSLVFGKNFSDHMFLCEWSTDNGWGKPQICPVQNISLHPAAKVFHYAIEAFEGMKAFRGVDGKIRLFRPELNVRRMLNTAERIELPTFDEKEFLKCLIKLVNIDQDWVPKSHPSSLYIRPTFIGTEPSLGVAESKTALLYIITGPVGSYFKSGTRTPVSLFADSKYVRAWPGGTGDRKMGANYAPTIHVQLEAEKKKLQQVLWLYGDDRQLTEVGTMNIFVFLVNDKGEKELVTPPLNGIILPGIVRQSVLDLTRKWNEFKVCERIITMKEISDALNDGRILEIFGSGTACMICPVTSINYMEKTFALPKVDLKNSLNERIFQVLSDIQSGVLSSSWVTEIK